MAFKRVRDILDRARQFHEALSEFYAQNAERAAEEKSGILLNYMSRHEKNMVACLAEYENGAAEGVLNAWFKFPPEMKHCQCFECLTVAPGMTAEDLRQTALRVDRCLLDLYRRAGEKATSPAVRELFAQLLALEEKEETKALREALSFDQQS